MSSNKAKMQWSLVLLILMGQCYFFTCHKYEYHFIGQNMSWGDARNYCREKYTDLATVYDGTDMKRLSDLVKQGEAWIGLHTVQGQSKTWHWSLPGVEFRETQWHDGEPNDEGGNENCVFMQNDKWRDNPCTQEHQFICYTEKKQPNGNFHLVNTPKSWPQAQKHCREHHTDLVSGLNLLRESKNKTVNQRLWIGLFRDTWSWSDGSNSSFRNWNREPLNDGGDKNCTVTDGSGKWSSDDCNETKPFLCYDDKMILIKEKMSWYEAVMYCSENYHYLVSITNPHQQSLVQARVKWADTKHVWLGLRYSCPMDLWFWVNDQLLCYDNLEERRDEECDKAIAMQKEQPQRWVRRHENEKLNFICAVH